MRKALIALTFFAGVCTPAFAAGPTPAMQLEYFIGSWNCTGTGAAHFTEHQSVLAVPGWLQGSGTITMSGQPAANEYFYLGWNVRNARWALISIDSAGNYAIATSPSQQLDGSTWSAAFPPVSGSGTLTQDSSTQYTIVNTFQMGGQSLMQRVVCTRA